MTKAIAIPLMAMAFLSGAFTYKAVTRITREQIASSGQLIGLEFSEAERDSMIDELEEQRAHYDQIRKISLPNAVLPSVLFNPIPVGFQWPGGSSSFEASSLGKLDVSSNPDELAFLTVSELSSLLRNRQITSEQLTRLYIGRLKKYGPKLECVITITEELALQQARAADAEIAEGRYRGPLHGIPYGIKDLLATRGHKTTWGSVPYKDQMISMDATVVKRLEAAGAVMIAKLTMGELAWGDVWYGGKTRNPWDYEEGSSGSSAGSASATAAGLVAFSIGTETWGSIVSPSTVCGVTGLRPTYGRVSRHGAMALSWSMDKIGPICRSAEDCALVFAAILGPDRMDPTVYDVPFRYDHATDLSRLRVGYLKSEFDNDTANGTVHTAALDTLKRMGVTLIPMDMPDFPFNDLAIILSAEAGAAFDELTRSGQDDRLVRQIKNAWPNVFRASRFIPAVEYIQANRVRTLLIRDVHERLKDIDAYVAPSFSDNLLLTNLTGHPCVVVPIGFQSGHPVSISFTGRLFEEGIILALAKKYQDRTGFNRKHPKLLE